MKPGPLYQHILDAAEEKRRTQLRNRSLRRQARHARFMAGADKVIWRRQGRAIVFATLLAGCNSLPVVVVEKEKAACEVPAVVTAPVKAPAKLVAPAVNEDMKNRMDTLDAALEKCNARLGDVQTVLDTKPKADTRSLREKLRDQLNPKKGTP